jgi:two-component system torCAD operon response regulator TorR
MLTARREDVDRLIGLEVGADDYVSKPFNERELVVRARNLLRRVPLATAHAEKLQQTTCRFAGWRFFPFQQRLEKDGAQVNLTRAESVLLSALVARPGTVLSRQQLRDTIQSGGESGDRTIDVLILRLRRKLHDDPRAPQLIATVPGMGYYFSSSVASDV